LKFEGSFKNKDAQNIIFRAFIPDSPKAVVVLAHGELSPGREIVEIAALVEGQGRAAVEQEEGPARRGHLHRLEEAIDDQDGELERVAALALPRRWEGLFSARRGLVGLARRVVIDLALGVDRRLDRCGGSP